MKRRTFCIGCLFAAIGPAFPAISAEPIRAILYKNPQCTCCEGYAAYLRSNGFEVDVKPTNDLNQISEKAGVPEKYQGCHTMFVDGYVVDGHVPVDVVRKLRSERPPIAGITLPGIDGLARHVRQEDAGLRHLCGHERWQGADGLRLGMTKARIANVLKTPVVNEKGPRRLRRK